MPLSSTGLFQNLMLRRNLSLIPPECQLILDRDQVGPDLANIIRRRQISPLAGKDLFKQYTSTL